jgi:DNA polymerase III subunit gamma/tau
MAYYHTYRPQTFGDIAQTQKAAAELLVSSLLTNRVSHAYLFTGSHGIGKTSSARILAKAINCEKYSSLKFSDKVAITEKIITSCGVPCNECSACTSITNGSAVDVTEMDAASNRGIDDMRDLREKVRLMPAVLSKKVYIIDEVHMLTTEAFNALLKTLEEPPKHVLFILCTTDKEKVPLTIQSRCTSVVFQRPTVETITTYLKNIASAEKLKIEEDALHFLARLSKGAYRDAAKYLEQATVLAQPITVETLEKQFIGGEKDTYERIISLIAAADLTKLLGTIKEMETQHVQFAEVLRELIEHFRLFIFYKSGVIKKDGLPIYTSFDYESFVQAHDILYFSECIDVFMKALGQQKTSPLPGLPLELACIKLLQGVARVPTRQVDAPISKEMSAPKAVAAKSIDAKPSRQTEASPENEVTLTESPMINEVTEIKMPIEVTVSVSDEPVTLTIVQSRWTEVVRLVKRYNASMAMLMQKCKPIELNGKTVTVETNYSFHKDMIESSKNRPVIEQAMYELLGAQLRVKGALSNTRLTPKQVENVKEVGNEDLMAAVQEIFGA